VPVLHQDDAVGAVLCDLMVVGDDDDRVPLLLEIFKHPNDKERLVPVKAGGRFVQHNDAWLHGNHAGNGKALALPAGEPPGVQVRGPKKTGIAERCIDDGIAVPDTEVVHPVRDLFPYGVGKEHVVRVLEDKADIPGEFCNAALFSILPVDDHIAGCRGEEPVEMFDQRGLSRTILTNDRHKFAFVDREIYARKCGDLAIGMGEVLYRDDWLTARNFLPGLMDR